jgi:outer membrane protein assembly factor BamB
LINELYSSFYFRITAYAPGKDDNLYEWRGPGRTGIYGGTNLLKSWPAEGPEEIWSIENLGNGFASPVFTDENFL